MEKLFKIKSKKLNDPERLEDQVNNVIKLFLTKHKLKNVGVEILIGRFGDDFANKLFTLKLSSKDV